ncbi:MAG: protein kinase, partial [Acidobacteriota bacterium]
GEVSGTPAYMAPEQLAGREVTLRSDLYALGLVLYEMFTGKRVFQAQSLQELSRLHEETLPESPAALVEGIDPATESVILRCLEKDPANRPSSALEVAAALPGGDPLARALAAGETPSPEMVAAAGQKGVLDNRSAALWLTGLLIGMVAFAWMCDRLQLHHWVDLAKPPQALADRAQEHLKSLGYDQAPADSAYGMSVAGDVLRHISSQDSPDKWEVLRTGVPAAALFWYRQSPRSLVPNNSYQVSLRNPPQLLSGMASIQLDMQGNLLSFEAVAPQLRPKTDSPQLEADWRLLFDLAGLDLADFSAIQPEWNPPGYADTIRAWRGHYPQRPDSVIRVHAASQSGKPVYFRLLGPWSRPERTTAVTSSAVARFGAALSILLSAASLAGALLLARRNLRSGRGDRQGATRLAACIFLLSLADWCLRANHFSDLSQEWGLFIRSSGPFLFVAAFLWLLYVGLEPAVRRIWPHNLVSWTRLLRGQWRDPLVGRDVLYGATLGLAASILAFMAALTAPWLGLAPHDPLAADLNSLSGAPQFLGSAISHSAWGLQNVLIVQFVLLALRLLLRKDWLAGSALVILFAFAGPSLTGGNLALILFFNLALLSLITVALMRLGLLTTAVIFMVAFALIRLPITTDFSAWYGGYSLLVLAALALLGAWGFQTSRQRIGQPVAVGS